MSDKLRIDEREKLTLREAEESPLEYRKNLASESENCETAPGGINESTTDSYRDSDAHAKLNTCKNNGADNSRRQQSAGGESKNINASTRNSQQNNVHPQLDAQQSNVDQQSNAHSQSYDHPKGNAPSQIYDHLKGNDHSQSDPIPKTLRDQNSKNNQPNQHSQASEQDSRSNETLVALAMHPDTPEKEWLQACHELNLRNIPLPYKPPKRINKARRIQLAALAILLCTACGAVAGSFWQKNIATAPGLVEPPYNQTAAMIQTATVRDRVTWRLANVINERGMSKSETAKVLGTTEETVEKIMHGNSSAVPLEKKIQMLFALDVPVSVNFNQNKNWQRSGSGEITMEDYGEAVKYYTRLIALSPNNAGAYFGRAEAESELKNYEQAIKDYTQSYKLDPSFTSAINNRENVFLTLGRYEDALKDNDELIRLEPSDWSNYSMRGIILHSLGKLDEALKNLNKAVEMAPQRPGPLCNRASLLEEMHRDKEAIRDYSRILEVDPTYSYAREKLDQLTNKIRK